MSSAAASSGPTVLVAPLDWGLGHATRCIPIIQQLLTRGCSVVLGGSGASGRLLRATFPDLACHELPHHSVHYAKTGAGLLWKIVQQLPQLRKSVAAEKQWLTTFLKSGSLDAVISDNRYGLFNAAIPSIFVTHQLEIRAPFGAPGRWLLRRLHYRMIERFSACWVPDAAGRGLAGALAHPMQLPAVPTRYIGPLSRFAQREDLPGNTVKKWRLVVLLSGPEPQRSIWEAELLPQLAEVAAPVLLLRGLPGATEGVAAPPNVSVLPHLATHELARELDDASFLLARSGYSTVMDVAALRVRSILVPTPGQPEQEYLAQQLTKNAFAPSYAQSGFNLATALAAAENFAYQFPPASGSNQLDAAIDELIARISRTDA
ncbi:MAG: glycosyl transferase family 28 [Chitinophagaceae bacterium]|nr:MAG: glycosyl transferase family 28 [Chitinophagaceae bacterium]